METEKEDRDALEGSKSIERERESIPNEKDSSNATKEDKGEQSENWKRVSIEKASRSPRNSSQELKFGMVTIVTPSRFAALSDLEENKEEEEKQIMEDKVGKEFSEENQVEEVEPGEIQTEKSKVVESEAVRQILPRNSKTYHRVLSEGLNKNEIGVGVMTRGSRKNH